MATTLHDIIDDIYLESQRIDSIFRNVPRHRFVSYGIDGLEKLNMLFATHIAGMNVEIPSSCRVYKPDDWSTFIRAYLIDCDGHKIELKKNPNVPDELYHYLVSCDGSLVKGEDGVVIKDECLVCNNTLVDEFGCECKSCHGTGKCISSDVDYILQALEKYKNSWVRAKDKSEYVEFSPDLEGMKVVIEYFSNNADKLNECELIVEKNIKEALMYFIFYRALEHGLETGQRAMNYYQKYKNLRDLAMSKNNAMTENDIYSVFFKK